LVVFVVTDGQMSQARELFNQGKMLSIRGLYPEAIEAYKEALGIYPGHTQARTNLKFTRYLSGIEIAEDRIRNVARFGKLPKST